MKNWQPPGIEPGPLTLAVSALPPELWPPGDSQPSQFSILLCMCRQNPARDLLSIRGGATLSEIFYLFIAVHMKLGLPLDMYMYMYAYTPPVSAYIQVYVYVYVCLLRHHSLVACGSAQLLPVAS